MKRKTTKAKPKYKRILLKLSGEALGGESGSGICPETVSSIAKQIGELCELGAGGHRGGWRQYFRGLEGEGAGIDRATGDYMGMPPPSSIPGRKTPSSSTAWRRACKPPSR